jgi:hypothetical protein
MLGSQLGIFLILILFKQLLSDKIFLEQEKNELGIKFIRIDHNILFGSFEINSKMWNTPLRNRGYTSVYHIFEFISS